MRRRVGEALANRERTSAELFSSVLALALEEFSCLLKPGVRQKLTAVRQHDHLPPPRMLFSRVMYRQLPSRRKECKSGKGEHERRPAGAVYALAAKLKPVEESTSAAK